MAFRHRDPLVFFNGPGHGFQACRGEIQNSWGIMSQNNPHLVIGLALIASLGGLLFGYDTAVISGAVSAIDHNFISPRNLPESARDSLSGWAVSCALLGCVIGAVVGGPIANRLGRKVGLMVAAILFLVGSLGSALPEFGLGPIGGMGAAALTPFIFYR